jgi:hypothetical protein
MNKEFISYEQALALKELGFDEPCFGYYNNIGKLFFNTNGQPVGKDWVWEGNQIVPTDMALAPLYQQAFRWFRKKYNLVHEISWSKYKGGLNFDYDVFSLVLPTDDELGDEDDIASDKSMETYDSLVDKDFRHHESNTYEEAELACLIKLIEIVKKK